MNSYNHFIYEFICFMNSYIWIHIWIHVTYEFIWFFHIWIHRFHEFIYEFGCTKVPDGSYSARRLLAVAGSCVMSRKEFTSGGIIMKVIYQILSKDTIKEFKILFIGIVCKATWKTMKKKAYIPLLCLPKFIHLSMIPKVSSFLISNLKKNQILCYCNIRLLL